MGEGEEMMLKQSLEGLLIILFAVAFPLSLAQGEEAIIEGLHIARGKGSLSVSFSVKNCFNQKMEEAIKAGIPTTFNFFVKLYKKRPLIWDNKIAARRFRHKIVYDTLKDTFRIWLEEKDKEIQIQDLEEAKRYMQRVELFPVIQGRELKKGTYELAIKAELDPVKLPLRLECILFFLSLWDFETDWYHHAVRVEP
jgi:hypothetical protein